MTLECSCIYSSKPAKQSPNLFSHFKNLFQSSASQYNEVVASLNHWHFRNTDDVKTNVF